MSTSSTTGDYARENGKGLDKENDIRTDSALSRSEIVSLHKEEMSGGSRQGNGGKKKVTSSSKSKRKKESKSDDYAKTSRETLSAIEDAIKAIHLMENNKSQSINSSRDYSSRERLSTESQPLTPHWTRNIISKQHREYNMDVNIKVPSEDCRHGIYHDPNILEDINVDAHRSDYNPHNQIKPRLSFSSSDNVDIDDREEESSSEGSSSSCTSSSQHQIQRPVSHLSSIASSPVYNKVPTSRSTPNYNRPPLLKEYYYEPRQRYSHSKYLYLQPNQRCSSNIDGINMSMIKGDSFVSRSSVRDDFSQRPQAREEMQLRSAQKSFRGASLPLSIRKSMTAAIMNYSGSTEKTKDKVSAWKQGLVPSEYNYTEDHNDNYDDSMLKYNQYKTHSFPNGRSRAQASYDRSDRSSSGNPGGKSSKQDIPPHLLTVPKNVPSHQKLDDNVFLSANERGKSISSSTIRTNVDTKAARRKPRENPIETYTTESNPFYLSTSEKQLIRDQHDELTELRQAVLTYSDLLFDAKQNSRVKERECEVRIKSLESEKKKWERKMKAISAIDKKYGDSIKKLETHNEKLTNENSRLQSLLDAERQQVAKVLYNQSHDDMGILHRKIGIMESEVALLQKERDELKIFAEKKARESWNLKERIKKMELARLLPL
eukprot:Tbor_TRINITY_DN5951_c1_g2::TRINITY_DN5951_c1_g2_i1::g.19004::m.19004